MRRYETIIILDPEISAEERTPVFDRISDTIAQGDGFLVLLDDWGARKLAYEIRKKVRGHYTRFDYCGTGAIVDEIERFCRIDDRLMKYLTVMIDENADVEMIKEEIARAESEKNKAEKAEMTDAAEDMPPVDSVETETREQTESERTDAVEDEPPADSVETETEARAEVDEAVTTESEANDTETKKED